MAREKKTVDPSFTLDSDALHERDFSYIRQTLQRLEDGLTASLEAPKMNVMGKDAVEKAVAGQFEAHKVRIEDKSIHVTASVDEELLSPLQAIADEMQRIKSPRPRIDAHPAAIIILGVFLAFGICSLVNTLHCWLSPEYCGRQLYDLYADRGYDNPGLGFEEALSMSWKERNLHLQEQRSRNKSLNQWRSFLETRLDGRKIYVWRSVSGKDGKLVKFRYQDEDQPLTAFVDLEGQIYMTDATGIDEPCEAAKTLRVKKYGWEKMGE